MTKTNLNVSVHHLTRVEGHGDIVVDVQNGEIKKCQFEVVEAPRFFEAFVRGRPYTEVNHITSRICGICSVGHSTASVEATEKALGVKLTKQAELLRKLKVIFRRFRSQPVDRVVQLINPILRGWVNYFSMGNSSRCFLYVRGWVEKKIRRHLMLAR